MAFPVPSHLPRNATSQDISSRILSKIASTSAKALNADLAASWVEELDQAILESKVHYPVSNPTCVLTSPQTKIHERIHGDLPSFEQQLASSKAVQERFTALTTNVNMLCDAVSHPEVACSHNPPMACLIFLRSLVSYLRYYVPSRRTPRWHNKRKTPQRRMTQWSTSYDVGRNTTCSSVLPMTDGLPRL